MRFSTSAVVLVGVLGSQAVAVPVVRENGLPRFKIGTVVKPLPEGHGPVVHPGETFNKIARDPHAPKEWYVPTSETVQNGKVTGKKYTREPHPPASSYLQLGPEEVHRLPEGHGPVVHNGRVARDISRVGPGKAFRPINRLPVWDENHKVARDPFRIRPGEEFRPINHLPVFDENHKVARDPKFTHEEPIGEFHRLPEGHGPVVLHPEAQHTHLAERDPEAANKVPFSYSNLHHGCDGCVLRPNVNPEKLGIPLVQRDPEPKHRVNMDHVAHRVGQGADIANDVTSIVQNGQQILHPNGKREAEAFHVHIPHFHHQQAPAQDQAQPLAQRDPEPKHHVDLNKVAHHVGQGASIANDVTSVIQNGQQVLHPNGKREADPEPFHVHIPHFHHQQAPSQDQAQPLTQRDPEPKHRVDLDKVAHHASQGASIANDVTSVIQNGQQILHPNGKREAGPEAFHIPHISHIPYPHFHQQAPSQDQAQPLAQREADPEPFHTPTHYEHIYHDQEHGKREAGWWNDHVSTPVENWMGKTFTNIHRREAEAEPILPHFRIGTLSPETEQRIHGNERIGVLAEPKKTARSFSA